MNKKNIAINLFHESTLLCHPLQYIGSGRTRTSLQISISNYVIMGVLTTIYTFTFWYHLQNLKDVLAEQIPKEQESIKAFRKEYGSKVIGEIQVDQVSARFTFWFVCFRSKCFVAGNNAILILPNLSFINYYFHLNTFI